MNIKDYNTKDTIAAIATFPETSALGVIKISGKKALPIISKIFIPKRKKNIKQVPTYSLHYGWIGEKDTMQNKKTTTIIDEVLVSIMKTPHTYTRDDVVEISSHGGTAVLNKILELILKNGGRLAYPGEFTYRAFVNGRIDLLQAQGIFDIVNAQTDEGVNIALRQLKGEVSQKLVGLKNELKNIFEILEVSIQFPDEEIKISLPGLKKRIILFIQQVDELIKGSDGADIFRKGVRCVVCGKPNSGKSTLFNCLVKEERVIVTKIAGTTRDVIEETIYMQGIPLKICDTAGVLEPKDLIEKEAVEKSHQKINEADIVLLLLDYSRPLEEDDLFLLEKVKGRNTVIVVNKIDLLPQLDLGQVKSFQKPMVKISALEKRRLHSLERAIWKKVYSQGIEKKENLVFLAQWQKFILQEIRDELYNVQKYLNEKYPVDFVVFSLKDTMYKLGKVTGEITSEEILNDIFKDFCIGK